MASFYGGKKGQDFSPTKTYNNMTAAWQDINNISSADLILINYGISKFNQNAETDENFQYASSLWKKAIFSEKRTAGDKEYYNGNNIITGETELGAGNYLQLVSKLSTQVPITFLPPENYLESNIGTVINDIKNKDKYKDLDYNTFIPVTIKNSEQTLSYLVYRTSPTDWNEFLLFDGSIAGMSNTETFIELSSAPGKWEEDNNNNNIYKQQVQLDGVFDQNGIAQIYFYPKSTALNAFLAEKKAYNQIIYYELNNGNLNIYTIDKPQNNFQIKVIY